MPGDVGTDGQVMVSTGDGLKCVDGSIIELRDRILRITAQKVNEIILSDDFKMPYNMTDEECEQYAKELVEKLIEADKST